MTDYTKETKKLQKRMRDIYIERENQKENQINLLNCI